MTERRIPKRTNVNIDEDTLEALKNAKGSLSPNEFLKRSLPLPVNRSLRVIKSLFDDAQSVAIQNDRYKATTYQVTEYFTAIFEGLAVLLKRGKLDDVLELINAHLQGT